MKRPTEISASDAVRGQIVLAAVRCEQPIGAAAEALLITPMGLKAWLAKLTGSAAWPPAIGDIEELLRRPVTLGVHSMGPVGRLATIAENMARLPPGSIAGTSRGRPVVRARQAVCWAIRQRYGPAWSYPMIGKALGGRDHSTVIHAIRVVEEMRRRDGEFAKFCDLLLIEAHGSGGAIERRQHAWPDWALDPDGWLARQAAEAQAANACPGDVPDPLAPRSGAWCNQCDALVGPMRAAACRDRWCSLRKRA